MRRDRESPAGDLVVPGGRSSPVVLDLDGDKVLDLLTGNTQGQMLYYRGPSFAVAVPVTSEGTKIDLPGDPRSRPWVGRWTSDGALDLRRREYTVVREGLERRDGDEVAVDLEVVAQALAAIRAPEAIRAQYRVCHWNKVTNLLRHAANVVRR